MPTTGSGTSRSRAALEALFATGQQPTATDFADFMASLVHPTEDALPASIITSGVFDNARVNFAAPAAIGGGTPAAGTFSALSCTGDVVRVVQAKTPASASATGTQGQIAWDADYVYVCVATDTWKRAALSTW